jgi:hypothetical protein
MASACVGGFRDLILADRRVLAARMALLGIG